MLPRAKETLDHAEALLQSLPEPLPEELGRTYTLAAYADVEPIQIRTREICSNDVNLAVTYFTSVENIQRCCQDGTVLLPSCSLCFLRGHRVLGACHIDLHWVFSGNVCWERMRSKKLKPGYGLCLPKRIARGTGYFQVTHRPQVDDASDRCREANDGKDLSRLGRLYEQPAWKRLHGALSGKDADRLDLREVLASILSAETVEAAYEQAKEASASPTSHLANGQTPLPLHHSAFTVAAAAGEQERMPRNRIGRQKMPNLCRQAVEALAHVDRLDRQIDLAAGRQPDRYQPVPSAPSSPAGAAPPPRWTRATGSRCCGPRADST